MPYYSQEQGFLQWGPLRSPPPPLLPGETTGVSGGMRVAGTPDKARRPAERDQQPTPGVDSDALPPTLPLLH